MVITNSFIAYDKKTAEKYYIRDDKVNIFDNMHFYVGFSIDSNRYKINGDFKYKAEIVNNGEIKIYSSDALLPIANAFVPIIGIKFIDYFSIGAECGVYGFYQPIKIIGNISERLKIKNLFVDLMGYLPLATSGNTNKVEVIIGVGAGHMRIKEDGSLGAMGASDNYSKYGVRAKLGVGYNINNNWGIRGLIGYQKVGQIAGSYAIDSVKSINLDLIYLI